MEVVKQYEQCTAQDIFETIVERFIKDYSDNTGELLQHDDICSGMSYEKNFGKHNDQRVRVELDDIVKNQRYCVSIFSNRGRSQMCYELTQRDEKVDVRYIEHYYPKNKWYEWNHKMLFWIMKKQMLRMIGAQLDALVSYTKNK